MLPSIIHLLGWCCFKRGLALTKWPELLPGWAQLAARDRTPSFFFFGELVTLEFVICRTIRGKRRPVVIRRSLFPQPSVGLEVSGWKGTAGFCCSQNEAGKQSCTVRPTVSVSTVSSLLETSCTQQEWISKNKTLLSRQMRQSQSLRTYEHLENCTTKSCEAKTWYDPELLDLVWFWHKNIDSANVDSLEKSRKDTSFSTSESSVEFIGHINITLFVLHHNSSLQDSENF